MASASTGPHHLAPWMAHWDELKACDALEKAHAYIDNCPSGFVLHNMVANRFQPEPMVDAPVIKCIDPKTGLPFARMANTRPEAVEDAILHAKEAFPAWSKTTRAVRSSFLGKISEHIRAHRDVFAVWESIDQGKTLERARVEVDRAIANFRYFSTYILHEKNTARMLDGVALTYEHRSPAGVFGLISPWNMPLYLLTWKIAPCLAFGCTAVVKPSEITSMSAYLLAFSLLECHLPPGVVNVVFGDGPTTGAALVSSPHLAGISFTGSTSTGILIRQATAHQIGKHLSLELGGKNATLVFADAIMSSPWARDRAVRVAAQAAFENQGEICLCGSRIYVERSVYGAFIEAFVAHVRETWVLGKTVGAVVSLEHYEKIRSYLDLAQTEGARFELGHVPPACPNGGYWIEPTVLTNVVPDSRLLRDEIFGPVVTVSAFDDEDEAVRLANASEYGLAAVLLTQDGARMRRVGEQLDSGLVWINSWLLRELGTPFGGMKNSGVGREGGEHSRDVFTVVRTIHMPNV